MKSRARSRSASAPHSVARQARSRTSPGPSAVQPKRAQGPSHEHGELDPQARIERATRLGHSFARVGVGADLAAPSGRGSRLANPVRKKMESAFGTDFSDVRVHQTPDARSIGAVAFTHGANVHFAPGKYDPESQAGQRLLGHELMHVVQQGGGGVRQTETGVNLDPSLEAEADRLGAKAVAGDMVQPIGQASGVQRYTAEEEVEDDTAQADRGTEQAERTTNHADGVANHADRTTGQADGVANHADRTTGQADGVANHAGGVADQVDGVVNQANGVADHAGGVADQTDGVAEQADRTTEQADRTTEQADGVTDHAGGVAEQADREEED